MALIIIIIVSLPVLANRGVPIKIKIGLFVAIGLLGGIICFFPNRKCYRSDGHEHEEIHVGSDLELQSSTVSCDRATCSTCSGETLVAQVETIELPPPAYIPTFP